MPLTSKGEEIKSAMQDQYGAKKGEQVFYASKNKGTITGVDEQQRDQAGKFSSGGGGGSQSDVGKRLAWFNKEDGESAKSSAEPEPAKSDVGQRLAWFNEDEMIPADNAATAVATATDEEYPQEDLPSQENPNTVPDTEGEGDPDAAAKAVFSNMPWPGKHL
jgi:hypothetical protein